MSEAKSGTKAFVALILLIFGISGAMAMDREAVDLARQSFSAEYPYAIFYYEGSQLARIYGSAIEMSGSAGPLTSAEQFRQRYSAVLGLTPDELVQVSAFNDDLHIQPVMYEPETGQYKFTLVYYSQYRDGIPVFRGELRLLVLNRPDYPIVSAVCAVRDLGSFTPPPQARAIDPLAVQRNFAPQIPQMTQFSDPRLVIWAGVEDEKVEPALGVEFVASDGNAPTIERKRYIVDPVTLAVLFVENIVIDVDVTGRVDGLATENFKSEQCGNEVSTGLRHATVNIQGGNSAYTDSTGAFVIPNSGSSQVTVTSQTRGRWFYTQNQAGSNSQLSLVVTPPGPANFLHNSANTEYPRAEVNGYYHANLVRDFTLRYNPTYPTIYNQTNFPVYVNDNTGYCPGNAWYDGVSITFCRASGSYPNTAFSTVIHHEYGHHLVAMAGSGQGQYGEGMGDVMGVLITDNPGLAYGFTGNCNTPLRNADNTIQYPCSQEIHYCGQLLSGCVWHTRNALAITNPTTYRDIIANLAINAMLLHTGTSITPSITIDYLTLDDNDGNIYNGTPHYSEICTGFNAHNMNCPTLNLLAFTYPNGRPQLVNPGGGTTIRVQVTAVGGTPQPGTGRLYYNDGGGWVNVSMNQVSPNVYDAVFPAFDCGDAVQYYFTAQTTQGATVYDPTTAPGTNYTATVGTGIITLFEDDFSGSTGWTGLGGQGEWTIGAATGGTGSDTHGNPDPAQDHSPTSDNRLLGTDLTSGTGGDYSANLSTTYWVTSPQINCAVAQGVSLEFYQWLGVERNLYDHAYLQVYNGTTWVTIFENSSTTIDENSWSYKKYDVSAYADSNANFRIRFGIGSTDDGWQFCGWNIDDIKVYGVECNLINGTVSGVVQYPLGALAGAIVTAQDTSGAVFVDTSAAPNGAYSLSLPPGIYDITFSHVDCQDTTLNDINVTAGGLVPLNVIMRYRPGAVKGLVVSESTNPIAGVVVSALGSMKQDTTGADGRYILTDIPVDDYDMTFYHPSYFDTLVPNVLITPGDTTVLNMTLISRCVYVLGDINGDGNVIGGDVTFGVRFFKGIGSQPPDSCYLDSTGQFLYVAGDVNGNCEFRGSDITRLVAYFKSLTDIVFCPALPPPLIRPGRIEMGEKPH